SPFSIIHAQQMTGCAAAIPLCQLQQPENGARVNDAKMCLSHIEVSSAAHQDDQRVQTALKKSISTLDVTTRNSITFFRLKSLRRWMRACPVSEASRTI